MTSTELPRRLGLVARLALVEYRAVYTSLVLATSVAPRIVLQVLFFALLGRYVGGEAGLQFAFVGATAHIVCLPMVVKAPDVLIDEKVYGTLYRLRLGRLPLLAVLATRQWVYAVEALAAVVLATVACGLLLGLGPLAGSLLGLLSIHVVVIGSTGAMGLATAVASVGKRADVLLPNLVSMVLLVAAGVVVPVSSLGAFGALSPLLPLTDGLEALRRALAGAPYGWLVWREALTGAGWALLAGLGLRLQVWRSRRTGHDEFF